MNNSNPILLQYNVSALKEVVEKKGKELLSLLQLTNRAHHRPDSLSGGEVVPSNPYDAKGLLKAAIRAGETPS